MTLHASIMVWASYIKETFAKLFARANFGVLCALHFITLSYPLYTCSIILMLLHQSPQKAVLLSLNNQGESHEQ